MDTHDKSHRRAIARGDLSSKMGLASASIIIDDALDKIERLQQLIESPITRIELSPEILAELVYLKANASRWLKSWGPK